MNLDTVEGICIARCPRCYPLPLSSGARRCNRAVGLDVLVALCSGVVN